ncbi:MAG: DUF948 domain-containing protein [Microcoleaceae cyanobacterium]
MSDPIFWLGLSILLVAVSLTAVLVAALPALQAAAKAARSLEKLADTLSREFPPTLEAIRMTGLEISELTDNVTEGVQSAGNVVKQVDQSLDNAKQQAKQVQTSTSGFLTGVRVAWKTFTGPSPPPPASVQQRRDINRLPTAQTSTTDYSEVYQNSAIEEDVTSDSISQTPTPEADVR